jgi:hypothetical protein
VGSSYRVNDGDKKGRAEGAGRQVGLHRPGSFTMHGFFIDTVLQAVLWKER